MIGLTSPLLRIKELVEGRKYKDAEELASLFNVDAQVTQHLNSKRHISDYLEGGCKRKTFGLYENGGNNPTNIDV
jgi:hypothetical protein